MKRKCSILIIIIISTCSINLVAQSYKFRVLTFFGKVDYRTSPTQNWNKVQLDESLKKDCEIKLDKNSYAVLMYNDGRTMEMMNEGIFNIEELERDILSSKMSVTQKFANFVAEEIIVDKSKSKTMKEFAAVVRVNPFHIESAIPSFFGILEPVVEFSWYRFAETESYVFNILNSENTPIYMDLVNDTLLSVDTEKMKLNKDILYKWYVFNSENPKISSDTNHIMVLSEENRDLILDTLRAFDTEIASNETPLNVLSLAFFYERNNLNLEALNQFNKVISLAPGSEDYKVLFAQFLINNKLYVRVSKLLAKEGIIYEK